jgi:hypothetical protein
MRVLAHGEYAIERRGQIIMLSCTGAWNDYTARQMCQDFLKEAKQICDKPWACLIDVSAWELGPPEIWAPVEKLNTWCNSHNQTYEAVVATKRIHQLLVKRSQEPLTNVTAKQFDTVHDALEWLVKQGIDQGKKAPRVTRLLR